MSIFSERILKSLNDYKRLLRRYLTPSEREKAIINLGIKRKSLKFDSDVILYNKAQRVLNDIDYWSERLCRTATEYSGVNEFYNHLKEYLSHYQIENNAIIHITQRVSGSLIQAIQLISSAPLPESAANKLEEYIHTIVKYGTKDQRIVLAKALHASRNEIPQLCNPTMDNFVKVHCGSMMACKEAN
jgi:hypothetical protein